MATATKLVRVDKVALGSTSGAYTVMENIIRLSNKLAAPQGRLVTPVPVINSVKPPAVNDHQRYWEVDLVLDGDNYQAFRNSDCNATSGSRVLNDSSRNDTIGYFVASGTDTGGNTVSYTYDANKTWLSYATGQVSNEPGTTRSPTHYRFACVGSRTVGSSSILGSDSLSEKYNRVDSVSINGVAATNILKYVWEFVGVEGRDILYPRFTPNVYSGLGVVEPSGKFWRMNLTFDTYTNLFDSYINDSAKNVVIPYSVVVTLHKTDGGSRIHTYQAGTCYVSGYQPSVISEKSIYQPGTVELTCIGSRSDST